MEVLNVFGCWLTVFESFYYLHVKFNMLENWTASVNLNFFWCNIKNLNAADIFQILQNLPYSLYTFQGTFAFLRKIKVCHRDKLFISIDSLCPRTVLYATDISQIVKLGHFSNL